MEPTALFVIAAILVVIGVIGTVVPVLPGVLLVFGGLLLAAWADHFTHVGVAGLAILGALALLALAADLIGTLAGAKRVKASPLALAGATIGALVGMFFGIPGLILGPFVGAFLGELLARGGIAQAGKVGFGTWIGLLVAALARLLIVFLMLATFAAFWLLG